MQDVFGRDKRFLFLLFYLGSVLMALKESGWDVYFLYIAVDQGDSNEVLM